MCGILSIFNKDKEVCPKLFKQALIMLNHRGPDEHHIQIENNIAFGHTRLSIVGVENGQQPLNYKDELVSIINGEFYDYKSTRDNFKRDGYQFATLTDSEIILPMYLKYGLDCITRLNGEFAGVIYDKNINKLIAFRDRHGVKPLFFRKTDQGISFGSEIKSILKYHNINPKFNMRELKDKIFGQPWDQDSTIFKDIYHVKPGHYLIYDINTGECQQKQYWKVDYSKENYTSVDLTEILSEYKSKLRKAIERRLVADVPVATYLSGGIDSSVCYGMASSIMGKGLDAFTIAFDDKKYDESVLAEKLVNKYNGTQYTLQTNEQLLADHFKSHIWCLEGITFNPHGTAKHLLSKLVREKGYKVVITGEGSDEYNCGYITSVIDAINTDPKNFNAKAIQDQILVNKGVFLSDNAEDIPFIKKQLGSSLSFCSNAVPQLRLVNSLLKDDVQDPNPLLKFERYFSKYPMNIQDCDFLNISLYYQSLTTFPYVLTALGDRTEMAHSVEARVPFLDNDVISLITKVPPKYKYYNATDKYS